MINIYTLMSKKHNIYKTIQYSKDSSYIGNLININGVLLRNGKGKMSWNIISDSMNSSDKYITKYTYEGNWKNNYKHGYGKLLIENYNTSIGLYSYEGNWINNKKHGSGTEIIYEVFPNFPITISDKYVGDWQNNKKHGHGKMELNNGSIYEGEWKNNMRNGYGSIIFHDGHKYNGNWKDDYFHGYGAFYLNHNTIYSMIILDNMYNPEEDKYTIYAGDWNINLKNGFSLRHTNEGVFMGNLANGLYNGRGKLIFYNYDDKNRQYKDFYNKFNSFQIFSHYFDGIFKNDYCLNGLMSYPNDCIYNGTFLSDDNNYNSKHGYGTMIYQDYYFYQGEWKNNLRDGIGSIIDYPCILYNKQNNKIKPIYQSYSGNWKNDMFNGHGIIKYNTNYKYDDSDHSKIFFPGKSILFSDTIIRGIYIGLNKNIPLNMNLYYDGLFKDDKMNGIGKLYDSNDEIVCDGFWKINIFYKSHEERFKELNISILKLNHIECPICNNDIIESSEKMFLYECVHFICNKCSLSWFGCCPCCRADKFII